MRTRRLGPDGIVIGGASIVLERSGAPAVLLLHGAGDTPQTLEYLAAALHAHGFHVEAPLLPGHGRTIGEFGRVTADGLTIAAREAYERIRAAHDWIAVVGLSMGGALAVQLAAAFPDMRALGLIAPYLAMPLWVERLAALSRLWGWALPVVRSGNAVSILDPEERERNLAYGVFTAAALRALRETMRRAVRVLGEVRTPTLMIQSREDNRLSVADGERAFAKLGAADKQLVWVSGAAHIITVDYGKEAVIAIMTDWLRERRDAEITDGAKGAPSVEGAGSSPGATTVR